MPAVYGMFLGNPVYRSAMDVLTNLYRGMLNAEIATTSERVGERMLQFTRYYEGCSEQERKFLRDQLRMHNKMLAESNMPVPRLGETAFFCRGCFGIFMTEDKHTLPACDCEPCVEKYGDAEMELCHDCYTRSSIKDQVASALGPVLDNIFSKMSSPDDTDDADDEPEGASGSKHETPEERLARILRARNN